MKRLLGTLFAATLVLSACSQDDTKENENKKSESTTEKKADDKKEDKKSKEEKKSQENKDNKSTQEDNSTEEQNTQETATNKQVQSQQQTQQPATQEQQPTQQANQQNYNNQQSYHEPTKDEMYEWDKQNIPGGTDYGLIDPEDVNIESEDNTRQNRIDEINQEMEDPNISDSDYNKLVEEYNELNNE